MPTEPTLGIEFGRYVTRAAVVGTDWSKTLLLDGNTRELPTGITDTGDIPRFDNEHPVANTVTTTTRTDITYPLAGLDYTDSTLENSDELGAKFHIAATQLADKTTACAARTLTAVPERVCVAVPTTIYHNPLARETIRAAFQSFDFDTTVVPIPIAAVQGHISRSLPGHSATSTHDRRYLIYRIEETVDAASIWVTTRNSSLRQPPFDRTDITYTDSDLGRCTLDGVVALQQLGLQRWRDAITTLLDEQTGISSANHLPDDLSLSQLATRICRRFTDPLIARSSVSVEECLTMTDPPITGTITREALRDQTRDCQHHLQSILGGDVPGTLVPTEQTPLIGDDIDGLRVPDDRVDYDHITSESILVIGRGAHIPGVHTAFDQVTPVQKSTPKPCQVTAQGAARIAHNHQTTPTDS